MTRSKLIVVSAIVIAGVALSWSIQRNAATRMREAGATSHELAGQLAQLQEENSRLSNQIAQAKPSESLLDEQFRELLRLRGEVSQLRGDRRETDQLRATNQQLSATLAKSDGT